MAKAGRKRKAGKRTASGRLSRAGALPRFDHGTERAQAMQALYGNDGSDAIGRAYRWGLIGSGSEAKNLLDTARRLSNAYWRAYETGAITCTLGERTFGSVVSLDHEKAKRREEWLNGCLRLAGDMGVRRAFDQLVIDVNPDHGPAWLDRLCWTAQQNEGRKGNEKLLYDEGDMARLREALDALETIAG